MDTPETMKPWATVPLREFIALVEAVAAEAEVEPGPERVVTEVAIANAGRALIEAVLGQEQA